MLHCEPFFYFLCSSMDDQALGDQALSDTVIEEEDLSFTILEAGTERKGRKLISSAGFSYVVKVCNLLSCTL